MHGERRDFLIQLAEFGAALLVGFRHPLDDRLELFLKDLDALLHLLAHRFGQRVEHVGLDDLALVHRRHGEAGRRAQDGDVLCVGLGVERFESLLLPGAELFLDRAAPRLIFFALENRRKRVAQLVDRPDHALDEGAGAARRQAERERPVRCLEIVDVHPVGRRRLILDLALEVLADGGGLAGRGRAQHEDVEVVARHVGAELDRLERALLPDQSTRGLKLGRGLEAEGRGIDTAPEVCNRQRRVRRGGDEPRCVRRSASIRRDRRGLARFGGLRWLRLPERHATLLLVTSASGRAPPKRQREERTTVTRSTRLHRSRIRTNVAIEFHSWPQPVGRATSASPTAIRSARLAR